MNGEGISDGLSAERKVEIRVRKNGRKDKVIVEKSAAQGLPEGWIKKLEITNRSGRKTRRDPFFIDPKSEYIFQSFKDASRYVETGNIGHYARKLKESDIEDDDSGNGKTVLRLEYVDKRSADDVLEKEKTIDDVRRSKRRNLSSSDEHSKNCKMTSDLSIVTSQVLEDLGKKEEVKDPIEKQLIAKRVTRSQTKASTTEEVVVDLKRNLSSSNAKSEKDSVNSSVRSQKPKKEAVMKEEEEQDSSEKRITRSKVEEKKNELSNSVARRTSKRLAGIELEPTPELKTRAKVQRIVPLDDEPTPELKTRTKVQRVVPPDDEPTPELKTRTKIQRIVPPDDEPTLELKTRTKVQRILPPDDELTPELKSRTKVQRIVPPDDELTPEFKTRTKVQQRIPPDDGRAGKCKQPVNHVTTSGSKKTEIPLNKEVAQSCNEQSSQKPHAAAATSNNRVSADSAVGIQNIGKAVGRKPSKDKKTLKSPLIVYELNPVFHLDGYKQKEEMSPVSPLSCQTSATKCEKTAAGKRVGRSSPKANLTTSVKPTQISPLRSPNKGKQPHPSDSGSAIQRRNKLANEYSNSSVVRGTCSEVMEKSTNSFSSAFDSTLADLCKDPCIAFAIKTLTGESLCLLNTPAISSNPINNHTKQKGVSFTPETPGNVNTCSEKLVFPSPPPGADIWQDPCIDFAIKTLTGAIPIGLDEPDTKSKSQGMTSTTAATQEAKGRQNNCDYMTNKTVGKPDDLRFTQSFSKD
ncbi:Methyl-CpG-binding domain-containing protein 13 [Arabidopsis thaliana]|uniref:Methyl-CpG DNA binding n=1 Tax=Arabidopsis thaliana x Arabidopsis arenosa TaxID=1240361 RepID=A0A8T2D2L4_9BRAS|nr:Methyl-CpG DNA binding [Arabidopsis thaliana x Arabidopsis arenosa]KAG7605790.1 Methyl-CpG DNA binding [Arabidopsis thaliana x Arabidopsis arenosa]